MSSETPVLFSKACELFIMELTLRSWLHTERSKRRTLQHCDTARAIMQDELLHFLVHAVPPLNSIARDYFEGDKLHFLLFLLHLNLFSFLLNNFINNADDE